MTGGSLTFATTIWNACETGGAMPSDTVITTACVPTFAWPGVPASVAPVSVSHAGRVGAANVRVTVLPSGSVAVAV